MEKAYFRTRTEAQIRNELQMKEASKGLVDAIVQLSPDSEGLIIQARLIPASYDSPRKFMKHGEEVKLPRFHSISESLKYGRTPVQLRWQAFDDLPAKKYCAFSFKPFAGTDTRTRKVSLVECLEGTQIYCYAHQGNAPIFVKPYDDAKRVAKDGAEIIVQVPSRREKQPRMQFKFSSVAVADSPEKLAIASSISTDHACDSKRFNIRYRFHDEKQSSRVFNFCAHEMAGYLAIIDHYMTQEKNIRPLEMNPFAIPTQFAIDFYKKLENNCLMQVGEEEKEAKDGAKTKKPVTRKLNDAEREILLWGLVHKNGHDKTFFAVDKVRDYDWSVPGLEA